MRVLNPIIRVLAVLLLVLVSFQSFAQGNSGRVEFTGEAMVEIADFFEEGRSELYYFVVDKRSKARTQIFFKDLPDAAFQSGAKVRIKGNSRGKGKGVDVEAVEIIEAAPDLRGAALSAEGPTTEAAVATPQTRKVLTLIVDFLDAVVDTGTGNAVTPAVVSGQMFNDANNVQHFYDTASLGTLTIPTDPNNISKEPIFGPYTINYNYLVNNGGTCLPYDWAEAALTAWENDGVGNSAGEDRTDYDSWSLIVPNYWDYSSSNGYTRACTWGGYAGVGCTQCWAFSADPASILFGVVIHELGHNFGFGHANSDTDNDGQNICGYCDSSDLMGGDREWMKFNAPHADFQGWWDPVSYDIDTISPSSTEQQFDLIPVDEEDALWPGLRAVKTARDGSSNYYFSYRQRTGHYNEVPTPYVSGVNIHWSSSSFYNGYTTNFYRMLEAGQVFEEASQDLVVWGVGPALVDDGQGNSTNVFTIKVCNSTCATLWPALNLTAAGAFPDTIQLSWQDYTYNEDGFTVEYSPDGSSWSPLGTTAADATTFSHNGLAGGSTFYYRVRSFRGASETSDWSNVASATTPAVSDTIGLYIATSDDDVIEVTSSGSMWLDGRALFFDYDYWNNRNQDEGIRYRNVPVPQGATINSAHIEYWTYNTGTGTNTVTFRAEDVDDAAIFTSASNSVNSRTLGSASVDWQLPEWSGGQVRQSPDLTSIIQPIVNRAGWAGGNAMVFVTESDYTGSHPVYSYDGSQYYGHGNTRSPKLVIDYTWTPPGNQAPTAAFTFDCADLECTFTDTSTDADGTIASWSWDFGDSGTSTAQNPIHTYAAYGNYNVSLTVTDDDGDPDTVVVPVTVQQVHRGPYLQTLTDTSVIVRWRTALATDSVVRYGLTDSTLSSTATVAGSTTEHTVVLTGLSPSTEYFYSIGDSGNIFEGDASFNFTTAPVPGVSVPTRFWVIGDSGTADANAEAVRDQYKEYAASTGESDFMLMLGDNAYNSGTDAEYQAAVFETYPELLRQLPVWPTLGNHDGYSAYSDTQTGPYYDIFDLPTAAEAGGLASGTEAYYSFDYGDIHFIVLDSYDTDRSANGTMMTWLESDLATNDKPWVVAFWHHPPYTKGSHDSDVEGELIDMRQNALPLLESWGVDLVLCGHSHSYERSMFLDGHYGLSTDLDVGTMVLNAGDGSESGFGAYEKPAIVAAQNEGAVYAVAGSSGKISGGTLDHPVMYISLNVLGSMVIDVDGNRLDAVFIDSAGGLRDEFTILKTADIDPPLLQSASAEDATHVLVDFSEFLDATTAENPANYAITGLAVFTAELLPGNRTVRLTTSSMQAGGYYLLTVNNVEDGNGNSIAPDSEAGFYFVLSDIMSFQDGVSPTPAYLGNFDASLLSNLPDAFQGPSAVLEVDGTSAKHIVIGWDISELPDSVLITAANIQLEAFDPSTGSFGCNTMIRNWIEAEVTWNNASNGVPWATAGATGATDRASEVLCNFGVSTGRLTIDLNAGGVAQVQRWADGTDPNYGLMLGNPTSSDGADFYSSEHGVPAERPKLEVTYTFAIPAPDAPTSLAATAISQTQINLGWNDNSINETGFEVERSPDGTTGWTNIASLGPSESSYSDTGLTAETTYYYRVYATNDTGDSGLSNTSSATTLAIPNVDPVAGFTYSCSHLDCSFTDTSTDSDGSITLWLWDFGDGNTSTQQNPAHIYAANGTYTVTLTVTDNDAGTDNTSQGVTVTANVAPTADFSHSATVVTVDFTDASTDSDGSIASWSWDFGDTTTTSDTSSAQNPSYVYPDYGTYSVTLTVTDDDGDTDVVSKDVTLTAPCTASKTMRASMWETFSLSCMPFDASVGAVFTAGPSTLTEADYNVTWTIFVYENLDNPTAGRPQGYTRLTVGDQLEEGKGYFFYAIDAVDIEIAGELNTGADIPLRTEQLEGIWNLVGNAHSFSVDWPEFQVNDGGTLVSLSNADKKRGSNYDCDSTSQIDNCLLSHVMLKWESSVYVASDGIAPTTGILHAIDAMWVRAHKDGIELHIPPIPAAAPPAENVAFASAADVESNTIQSSAGSKIEKQDKGRKAQPWFVRLVAESGDIRDRGNWIGQLSEAEEGRDARDLKEFTPFGNPYLSIVFTNPLLEESGWGYTTDYRELTKSIQGEWPFVVRASSGITEVTLSWEGQAHLFDNAVLVDEVSGESMTIEAGGQYTFAISGGSHAFRLVMNQGKVTGKPSSEQQAAPKLLERNLSNSVTADLLYD